MVDSGQGKGIEKRAAPPTPDPGSGNSSTSVILGGTANTDALLESLISNAPTPIFVKNPEGVYLHVNAAYEQRVGIAREQVLGRTDFDLYPPEAAARHRQTDIQTMHASTPTRREGQAATDGRTFTVVKVPIVGEQDEILGICGISVDIIDRLRTDQARNDERDRLTAELHDDAVQVMAAVALTLENLEREAATQEQERLGAVRGVVSAALQRLRTLMSDMQSPGLSEMNLRASLEKMLEAIEQEHSISFSFQDEVDNETLSLVAVDLFRIAREAVINVTKHAQASHLEVSVAERGGGIQMTIVDDGIGFDKDGARSAEHLGLFSMRARAHSMGGDLLIHSHGGGGTRIEVWVPGAKRP